MIKDVGATEAEGYNDTNWDSISLTLEDGWWIYEISEEIYNDDSIWIYVNFYGETSDGGEWMISYYNGKLTGSLLLPNELRTKIAQVYFTSDWVSFNILRRRQMLHRHVRGRCADGAEGRGGNL